MTFRLNIDTVAASSDGERLALEAKGAFVEPGVSVLGTNTVFSRTPLGWTMTSATAPEMAGDVLDMELRSPDLSQVAVGAERELNPTGRVLDVGPVDGPYATVASAPPAFSENTRFLGANAGTSGLPAFSDVIFWSKDHMLLPPGPEHEAAEGTELGRHDLYEWSEGRLRLVNVDSEGKLLNPCGATLGEAGGNGEGTAINAVSADGSRVFFTSPEAPGLAGCPEPQLYMRVGGKETVDLSEPEGVSVPLAERGRVDYDGATADGSKVFFTTETALTPEAGNRGYLYEYDVQAPEHHRLILIANEVNGVSRQVSNPGVIVSEDGSTIYYGGSHEGVSGIFRYDVIAGTSSFVAAP
jgi:hypothetical protein